MTIPQITIDRTELIDHEAGFVTMRLHCTLPNGAHYFVDEDDWHVAVGDKAVTFAEFLNQQLTESNGDVTVVQIVGDLVSQITSNAHQHNLFTIVDTTELVVMSESEQYAHEQCLDSGWDTEMELDRELGYTRGN